ncbi:hypothetical protein CMI45_02450 [Candidatus Pacearchaeota archaeon]|nr:hypothetical protein [Candidatus Pacearchaeota archaeon]|tara:strand:+ start:58 stop:276 length:219 start_codon:yes stop_codon:yes gene_type:complete
MSWDDWSLKKKIVGGSIAFIIAYILTIPIRDYSSLGMSEPTLGNHLTLIVAGIVVYIILLVIFNALWNKIKN